MNKIAFFDTKPYDKIWFNRLKSAYDIDFKYFESKLTPDTAVMAKNYDGAVAFVNDNICAETLENLKNIGVKFIAMRCSGYNNVDLKTAEKLGIKILRVPVYSPYAVAEHAVALLLCLNRKIHRAYIRTKEYNFNINGLEGFDLYGKTVGIIGTGKIGRTFINVMSGFNVKILAYDVFPSDQSLNYVSLDTLLKESDIISLHCPLTKNTHHLINKKSISVMKDGVIIINTSRGSLIDSNALLDGIKCKKIGGAGLDVYEEESDFFYEDFSDEIIEDDVLSRLISMPNVLITSHQAFLTNEALSKIAEITLNNINDFYSGKIINNEITSKNLNIAVNLKS